MCVCKNRHIINHKKKDMAGFLFFSQEQRWPREEQADMSTSLKMVQEKSTTEEKAAFISIASNRRRAFITWPVPDMDWDVLQIHIQSGEH